VTVNMTNLCLPPLIIYPRKKKQLLIYVLLMSSVMNLHVDLAFVDMHRGGRE
jgi:hypothetical protein